MRVVITGANGQVGWELSRSVPTWAEAIVLPRKELDITNRDGVFQLLRELKPDIVINAAAYTQVDRAESEPELAHKINAEAPGQLAGCCVELGARLIHISTDAVFSGGSGRPWQEGDNPNPVNVYGASKLAGEQAILRVGNCNSTILRTAWVYSVHGNNFIKTILRLFAQQPVVRVVDDQLGTPTSAAGLAGAIWRTVQDPDISGILHWTDAGSASWYDVAQAIGELGVELELLQNPAPLQPISSAEFPRPAPRALYAVLDKHKSWGRLAITPGHWREALAGMMQELAAG
jgi:dTDP-4-dehydrorhamnose reductase